MKKSNFALHQVFRFFRKSCYNIKHLYSEKEFWNILDRERARVDRNDHVFSLVIFQTNKMDCKKEFKALINLIKSRARTSDVIGWLRKNNLGVLLPETARAGAWKFADDIMTASARLKFKPECFVYTYPLDRISRRTQQSLKSPRLDFWTWDQVRSFWDATPSNGHAKMNRTSLRQKRMDSSEKPSDDILLFKRIPTWKRVFDIVGATTALILLAPLFGIIALYIKLVSPGPVFYKQTRIGLNGKPFEFWKFRTMKANADTKVHEKYTRQLIRKNVPMTKLDLKNDDRIIPFGHFLRQSGLDELPQLFNVIRGEMSLVGPRPSMPYEVEEFLPWHKRRFDVLPGLTGSWQVNGKNRTTFNQMMRLDIAYAQNYSLLSDIKIILKTVPAIVGLLKEQAESKKQYNPSQLYAN